MAEIRTNTPQATKNLKTYLAKFYGLTSGEVVMRVSEEDGGAVVEVRSPKKVDTRMIITVEDDGFKAVLTIFPPINGGKEVSLDEIMDEIAAESIKVNLKTELVKSAYENLKQGIITDRLVIAEGVRPINGRDAELIPHFVQSENRPKEDESGRVDFKDIDNIIRVRKGDLLITKKPFTVGVNGVTVRNVVIEPNPGADKELRVIEGVTSSVDGLKFYADIDGYVNFAGDSIGVYPVYFVKRDVDYSTGNIKFNGTVHVKGDVLSDFSVEAERDIIVDGIVQDANLRAGGDIIIKIGIKGNMNHTVEAEGNVTIGYAENGRIRAKKDLNIKKYAFNCELFAGQKLEAIAGDGIIAGGSIRAFSELEAKQVGTTGNSKFAVMAGMKYYYDEEMEKLRLKRESIKESMDKVNGFLSKIDVRKKEVLANPKVRELLKLRKGLDLNMEKVKATMNHLIKTGKYSRPRIKVHKRIFEGVTVQFFNVNVTLKDTLENVVFFYEEKFQEVSWVSLKDADSLDEQQQKAPPQPPAP